MKYEFVLHTPNEQIPVCAYEKTGETDVRGFHVRTERIRNGKYEVIEATVSSDDEREVYISLAGEGEAKLFSFNGACREERIFRQSPHDPARYHFKMQKSAVPMVAAVNGDQAEIFISDNPSYFDNATTQRIVPEEKRFYLSSGDPGGEPNFPESDKFSPIYHKIKGDKTHTFRFITFKAMVKGLKGLRREAFLAIEKIWGIGSDSPYRAMCFASNYMHIRKNETGNSEKWVVAGIEYSNAQYFRDSFYQTMVLDEETQAQSYQALSYEFKDAENPLVYMIWSYRVFRSGKSLDRKKLDLAFATVLAGMDKFEPNDSYYPNSKKDGDFRCWFDTCAFAPDDADLYNQGLLVCALEASKRLGYDIGDRKERALRKYHDLFNGEFFPLSEQKQCMTLDFAVGEVIYYLMFNELFIDQTMFEKTYRRICDGPAKTKYGIKIIAEGDGSYVPLDIFSYNGYLYEGLKTVDVGRYHFGGSWHLYEMLFHVAGHLHGMPDAEKNLTERLMIDLDYNGTTNEYMHTVTGVGVKANQGWNAAIWAIWNELIKRGSATDAYFLAADAKIASIE